MALTHLLDLFFQNNALMLLATFSAELLRDPEEVVFVQEQKKCPLGRRVVTSHKRLCVTTSSSQFLTFESKLGEMFRKIYNAVKASKKNKILIP